MTGRAVSFRLASSFIAPGLEAPGVEVSGSRDRRGPRERALQEALVLMLRTVRLEDALVPILDPIAGCLDEHAGHGSAGHGQVVRHRVADVTSSDDGKER